MKYMAKCYSASDIKFALEAQNTSLFWGSANMWITEDVMDLWSQKEKKACADSFSV